MQSPHDTLFQFTFRHPHHAAGWLRSVLPAPTAAAIDWPQLTPIRERFPGVRVRPHLADAGFVAPLLDAGEPHDVLLLVEHKSAFDPGLEAQLLRYSIHLQRALQPSPSQRPFVVPVVLQHGAAATRPPPEPDPARRELFAAQPRQRVYVDDLEARTEEDLAARSLSPLAELTLLCLRTLRDCPPDEVPAAFDRWQHLLRAVDRTEAPPHAPPLGADATDAIGWYALATTEVGSLRLSETFARILHRPENTIMSTLERTLQKGIAQGITQGRTEGRNEGRSEGRAETILRILQRRFGPLAEDLVARLRTGSPADLDRWTDRVLDARTLADVFAD
jgi:hypothetical protein